MEILKWRLFLNNSLFKIDQLFSLNIQSYLYLIFKSLSDFLNRRGQLLDLDYLASISLPNQYDTDLENFWTQTS
jgi:hypothetical protein